jgi:hypothetical protein
MEAAIEAPVVRTSTDITPAFSSTPVNVADYRNRFTISVGGMVNRSATRAIGGTVGFVLGTSNVELPARAELRLRNWRGKTAFDYSIGAARKGIETSSGELTTAHGGTAAFAIEYGIIGAEMRTEVLRGGGKTVAAGLLSAKATSGGAPIAVALALAAVFALVTTVGD